jgi:hypothetical protein
LLPIFSPIAVGGIAPFQVQVAVKIFPMAGETLPIGNVFARGWSSIGQ